MERVKKQLHCPTSVLKLFGDFWTLYIIQELSKGERRFSNLEKTLIGINPATLVNRLKKLEKEKIIERNATNNKLLVTYKLTPKGFYVLPIISEIEKFSKKMMV